MMTRRLARARLVRRRVRGRRSPGGTAVTSMTGRLAQRAAWDAYLAVAAGLLPAQRAVEGSVQEKPPAATPAPRTPMRGLNGDCLLAPDGRTYRLADARLSPRRAYELVVAGAVVAFDDCGCDGFCGLAWADHDKLQRLVRHGPPRVRRKGKGFSSLEEWRTDSGDPLVVARGDVRWA